MDARVLPQDPASSRADGVIVGTRLPIVFELEVEVDELGPQPSPCLPHLIICAYNHSRRTKRRPVALPCIYSRVSTSRDAAAVTVSVKFSSSSLPSRLRRPLPAFESSCSELVIIPHVLSGRCMVLRASRERALLPMSASCPSSSAAAHASKQCQPSITVRTFKLRRRVVDAISGSTE